MKLLKTIFLIILVSVIYSCSNEKQAIKATEDLFFAIKNKDEARMQELYPYIFSLPNYYYSDSIKIGKVESLGDNNYSVNITNVYTNNFGKTTELNMYIYAKPKDENTPNGDYIVYDTKGLCDLSEDYVFQFARNNGYLAGVANITDMEAMYKKTEAKTAFIDKCKKFIEYLKNNVLVSSFNWELMYTSASGSASVKNNTPFSIPKLKYVVTFYDRKGTQIAQDNGYVNYLELPAHGVDNFSIFTSHVSRANNAKVELVFDDEFIMKTVAYGDYR